MFRKYFFKAVSKDVPKMRIVKGGRHISSAQIFQV